MRLLWATITISAFGLATAFAQGGAPTTPAASPVPLPEPSGEKRIGESAPPPLKNLRYDEDFSHLLDDSQRVDRLDQLKFIALNRAKTWYLTVGGEARLRYEIYRNDNFGAGRQDANGYFLQRLMLHADLHFGKRLRFFAQIKSGLLAGRSGGARPADLDKLDLHQAFADVAVVKKEAFSVTVRAGRQEAEFGSSRLVSVREGANVRQSFDGARIFLQVGRWQVSPWFFKPVTTGRGFFDDRPNNEQAFFGAYAARNLPRLKGLFVVYANRLDTKTARYEQGAGRERRDTVGARIAGKTGAFDFNYEAVGQFGRFRADGIRAWAVITDTGYSFPQTRFRPRLAVRFDSTSGDENPRDGRLQTFNPLFASPVAYSGLVSLISPSNSTALIPSIELNLSQRVVVKFDDALFWRTSRGDALYGAPDTRRGASTSRARFVGNQPSAQIVYRMNRYLSLTGVYTHFFAGSFLRETPPAKDVDYLTSYLTFKF